MTVTTIDRLPNASPAKHYPFNQPPLLSNPLSRLPLGSVRPHGWLRHQLNLMAQGMFGRLPEISPFLGERNGWLGGNGYGWEEQPYWLRGFYDLAVLTGDEDLLATASRWIDAVLATGDSDGYFGPRNCKSVVGKGSRVTHDLWPHMVMIDALISHYEFRHDERIPALLTRFFQFCRRIPETQFIPFDEESFPESISVQHDRAGDMIPHIHWLYNRTGEQWLLELAERFYRHIRPPKGDWLADHGVDFTQRFAYPALFAAQARDPFLRDRTEYWYQQHLTTWGQHPRGIFGADERSRPGKTDPRQGFETCSMVEFARSFYLLSQISGESRWADRAEDVLLNHFPAAVTADMKGLHYLTASNMPQLDNRSHHDFYNERVMENNPMLPFSPHRYRCCQHNAIMGWPGFIRHLWMASADGGLVAWMHGDSTVDATVSDGRRVTIHTDGGYPFRSKIDFTIDTTGAFPLYLRVPAWATSVEVRFDGSTVYSQPANASVLSIDHAWNRNDRFSVSFGRIASLTRYPRNGSGTVEYGPLSYSIAIPEQWKRLNNDEEWPEYEVFPTAPWNYALVVERDNPAASLLVDERTDSVADQPWTAEDAPVTIHARALVVPGWTLDDDTVGEVPPAEAADRDRVVDVRLIPLGCSRLRMACLPVVETETGGPQEEG